MSSSIFNILNFSDEILTEIILNLNARERISLGKSCTKFYSLTFEDEILVRDLDFSKDGYLTTSSDVQHYFKNESMLRHVKRINLGNMYCRRPIPMLQDIMKATNLVEVNIIGIPFDNFLQLRSFLEPLKNLIKLSFGWPDNSDHLKNGILQKSWTRLKHLTVRIYESELKDVFVPVLLPYLFKLEELFLLLVCDTGTICRQFGHRQFNELEFPVLPELKIVAGYTVNYFLELNDLLQLILPDPERWTEVSVNALGLVYYEKDITVIPEMSEHVDTWEADMDFEGPVMHIYSADLLADVVYKATREDAKNLLHLYAKKNLSHPPATLTIKDIKQLLKHSNHRVHYIHIQRDLEPTCAASLSAFPHLTKLVLSGIIKVALFPYNIAGINQEFEDLEEPNEAVNSNPVLQELVENTPHLKDFMLEPKYWTIGCHLWDVNNLHLISGWKKLTTLSLANIPIVNGKFLIEIGKQCENLAKLRLEDLGPNGDWCYKNELTQMLTHCRNLKDFSITQNICQISDVFTMFAGNRKLQRLHVKSYHPRITVENLVFSVETLMRFHDLALFMCEFGGSHEAIHDALQCQLQRLKDELNRTAFEFEIVDLSVSDDHFPYPYRNNCLDFAHEDLLLPFRVTNALYQLGC